MLTGTRVSLMECAFCWMHLSSGGCRGILGQSPLRPGSVVDGGGRMTEKIKPERDDARCDAGRAGRHDGALQIDFGGRKSRRHSVRGNERAGFLIDQISPRNVGCVRDMS